MEKRSIVFYGKVQRVSFRRTFKKICDENEIYGFVKNNFDKSVICEIYQSKKNLENFLINIKKKIEKENFSIKIEKIKIKKFEKFEKFDKNFKIIYQNKFNKFLSFIHYVLIKFIKKIVK